MGSGIPSALKFSGGPPPPRAKNNTKEPPEYENDLQKSSQAKMRSKVDPLESRPGGLHICLDTLAVVPFGVCVDIP